MFEENVWRTSNLRGNLYRDEKYTKQKKAAEENGMPGELHKQRIEGLMPTMERMMRQGNETGCMPQQMVRGFVIAQQKKSRSTGV